MLSGNGVFGCDTLHVRSESTITVASHGDEDFYIELGAWPHMFQINMGKCTLERIHEEIGRYLHALAHPGPSGEPVKQNLQPASIESEKIPW